MAPAEALDPALDRPAERMRTPSLPLGLQGRRTILIVGDLVLLVAITLVALRLGALRSGWPWSARFLVTHSVWLVLLAGFWFLLAMANGLYDPRRTPRTSDAAVLSIQVSLQLILVWALFYFIPPPWTLVRHVVVFFAGGAAVAMPLWRQLYAAVFSRAAFRRRLFIVGAGAAGRELLSAIRQEAPHAFEVVGFVDDDPAKRGSLVDGVRVLAGRADLVALAHEHQISELALAISHSIHGEMFAALMDACEQGLAITPMPLLYESITGRVPVEHIGQHWGVALPLDQPASRGLYRLFRRVVDAGVAVIGLVVLVPLLVVLAPLLKATSPGPLFFRQQRVGRGGRPFRLIKLRTMIPDAERLGPNWTAVDDPRVTPLGRWLRRTRLDELPQVINILRGEMSLIGPRPERPELVAQLARDIPFYRARHAVRPGLTGWATIHQGYASSTADSLRKLQYDLYYIKHQSPYLDALILLGTLATVLRLRGR